MTADTLSDSASLVEAKFAEFKAALSTRTAQRNEYNQAVNRWNQKSCLQQFLGLGYPNLSDYLTMTVEKTDVINALRQQPATYPLGAIWSHQQWTDKRFWYVFEHFIEGHQFVVEYPRHSITAQLSDGEKPLIEVKEGGQDPLLHLPTGFRIPVYTSAYDDCCPRRMVSRYAYWAPKLSDTPTTITISDGALSKYRWAKTREDARTYLRTQVVR